MKPVLIDEWRLSTSSSGKKLVCSSSVSKQGCSLLLEHTVLFELVGKSFPLDFLVLGFCCSSTSECWMTVKFPYPLVVTHRVYNSSPRMVCSLVRGILHWNTHNQGSLNKPHIDMKYSIPTLVLKIPHITHNFHNFFLIHVHCYVRQELFLAILCAQIWWKCALHFGVCVHVLVPNNNWQHISL